MASKFSLKLMVHKQEKRVIFAEADSNFVDTLFSIMTLPMAIIIRLLRQVPDDHNLKPIGSLNNLYGSLLNLPTKFLSSEENQWLLLNPITSSSHDICGKLKLNLDNVGPTRYFICQNIECSRRLDTRYSINCDLARCIYCGKTMSRVVRCEDSTVDMGGGAGGGVFVSDLMTFIVTDDLRVMPNSPGSIFKLLGELGVTSVGCLEELPFDVGFGQILDLLKGAFLFKNPLTYVVFPNSPYIRRSSNDQKPGTLVKNETAKTSKGNFTLKVTMQKSTSKFLFAEADSNFVEFLFGFLQIPLATLIGELLIDRATSFTSLKNMLSSISSMTVGDCTKSHDRKSMLLQPQLMRTRLSLHQIFSLRLFSYSNSQRYYCHTYMQGYFYRASLTRSSGSCVVGHEKEKKEKEVFSNCSVKDSPVDGRYLKPSAKFMLSDDLVITPLTSYSSITMLGNLKVPFNDVEVHIVEIGYEEALEMLDVSVKYVSGLTDYILKRITN